MLRSAGMEPCLQTASARERYEDRAAARLREVQVAGLGHRVSFVCYVRRRRGRRPRRVPARTRGGVGCIRLSPGVAPHGPAMACPPAGFEAADPTHTNSSQSPSAWAIAYRHSLINFNFPAAFEPIRYRLRPHAKSASLLIGLTTRNIVSYLLGSYSRSKIKCRDFQK